MKRFFLICLAIAILLVALPIASSVALSQYGTVTGGWLRLRSAPSFDASTVSSYYTGTQVKILATSGSWYQVEAPDGKTGYMYASYISFSGGGGSSAYVTSSNGLGVRMRSGPGTGYSVVGVYSVGTAVTVLQTGTTWSKLQIGTRVGYMMNKFLTTSGGGGGGTGDIATVWSANGYGVRLRSGAGTSYSILGVYSVGTQVSILSHGTTWDHISVGSRTGYMMNQYLVYNNSKTVSAVTLSNTTPVVGSELHVASITPAGATVTYEWSSGTTVVGTEATYTVSYGDIGKQIKLKVTGTGSYTGSATSAPTSSVIEGISLIGGALNNPSPVVGDVLQVVNLQPSGAKATYKWYVGGTLVGTNATYTVTSANLDQTVTVEVTGTGLYMGSFSIVSDSTVSSAGTVQEVTITNTTNPTETGKNTPNVYDVLSAAPVPETATVSYKWTYNNGGTIVTLGTSSKLTVPNVSSLLGKEITVMVTGTGRYIGGVSPDDSTGPVVNLKNLTEVRLDNYAPILNVHTGITATVYAKDTTDPVTGYCMIAWYRDGEDTGITGTTYTLSDADLGHLITATATADGVNFAGSKSRSTTSRVRQKLTSVAIVNKSGEPTFAVGDVLTAVFDGGADVELSTQNITLAWKMNGVTSKTLEYTVPSLNPDTSGITLTATTPAGSIYYIDGSLTNNVAVTKATMALPGGTLEAPVAGETYTLDVTPTTAKATYLWTASGVTNKTTTTPALAITADYIGKVIRVTVTPGTGYQLADGAPNYVDLPAAQPKPFEAIIIGHSPVPSTLPSAYSIYTRNEAGVAISVSIDLVYWCNTSETLSATTSGSNARNLTISNTAWVGQTLKAKVHGTGIYTGDVWTTAVTTDELSALMSNYSSLVQSGGLSDEPAVTDTPVPQDTTATETPVPMDTTATDTPAPVDTATAESGETATPAPEFTAIPAGEPVPDANTEQTQEPITYTAQFNNLPSKVVADTDLTVLTNAESSVQTYAWYKDTTLIDNTVGNTYRVTQSDIDAGYKITVYVTFADGQQASTWVQLKAPLADETMQTGTEGTEGEPVTVW